MANKQKKLSRLLDFSSDKELALFELLDEIEQSVTDVNKVFGDSNIENLTKLKGEKGDKGDKGDRGTDGRNGKDGRDGRDGLDGFTPVKGVDYFDGKDGKDGVDGKNATEIDMQQMIVDTVNYIESLEGDERIDAKAIKNLPTTREIVREVAGGFIETPIKAGSNTTVTKDASGSWVISSTGGGGGISDGDKGDITVSGSGTVWNIDAGVVGITELSATGTPSASTFLRGDNTWATPAGSGDVVGPASSTDNAITRFDSTTGKLIQNSTVTLSDDGIIGTVKAINYDLTQTGASTEGRAIWDDNAKTLEIGLKNGFPLKVGQQLIELCVNNTGSTIAKGKVVYVNGGSGNRPTITLADNTAELSSARTFGITAESITNGNSGYVVVSGILDGLNTNAYTAGTQLYLGTSGDMTSTKPVAPAHMVYVAKVITQSATVGVLYVQTQNGYELNELHDVLISTATAGQTLLYDNTAKLWKNASLTAGTGISLTPADGALTVTNSAPDQTVSLTGAGGTSISGTYPNFTITTPTGNVTKVGTPVDNQIGVWTGDGTLEGDTALTFDTSTDTLTSGIFNGTALTASRILASDASKNIVALDTTTYPSLTELSYVKGVTSAVQTQLNNKAATGAITGSGLTMATNKLLGRTTASTGAIEEITVAAPLTFTSTTLDFDETATLGNNARVAVSKNGSLVGTRRKINFIEGTNVTLTIADDSGNEEVDVTIASSGSGGGTISQYIDQTPDNGTYGLLSGSVNGSNTVFTVSQGSYGTGTLQVYLNGVLQEQGSGKDWTETTPASGTFTFATAPQTGDIITVSYQNVAGSTIGITAKDEGATLTGALSSVDFVGAGVTATNSGGAVTVTIPGGGIAWSEVTGTTQTASVDSGYITNNASLVTITLPTTAAVGKTIRVTGSGAGGWRIAQNTGQKIVWDTGGVAGTNETTTGTGGRLDSGDAYDSIELICITANTTWGVLSSKGNITIT